MCGNRGFKQQEIVNYFFLFLIFIKLAKGTTANVVSPLTKPLIKSDLIHFVKSTLNHEHLHYLTCEVTLWFFSNYAVCCC